MTPGTGTGPTGGSASRPDRVADAALLAVSLTAGLGALRLASSPTAVRGVAAVAGCVIAGHVVSALVARRVSSAGSPGTDRRSLLSALAGAGAGAVAVGLVAGWALLWSATSVGVPTLGTLRAARSWFEEAGGVITAGPTPVPATTGIVLCLALGAGALAVLGRALWAWQTRAGGERRRPLVVLVPASGYFAYTALLSSDHDRPLATLTFLAAALLFVARADRAIDACRAIDAGPTDDGRRAVDVAAGAPRTAHRARRRIRPGLAGALGAVALVVGLTAVTAPALASMHVHAFPQATGGPSGSGPGGVGTVALLDSLAAPAAPNDETVMFTARSRVPTYWQVASLSQFDGVEWTAEPSTLGSALPEPQGPTFTATVEVAALRTTLLPVPPGTEQVLAPRSMRLTTGGNVEASAFSSTGTRYAVVARIPAGVAGGPSIGSPGYAGVPASALAPYLSLPRLSPAVAALARRVVSGAVGPLAEADALVHWLDSGRYRYSVQPPSSADPDPLSGFLFDTRTGFCQQFAGAFAVMARVVGLPSRVAVGFGAGSTRPDDTVAVRATDAHTWPEVYFGPAVGWVSFEPTPGGTTTPASVRQGKPLGPGIESLKPPRTTGTTSTTPLGSALAGLVPGAAARTARTGSSPTLIVLPVVGALALAAGVALSRRPTRRRVGAHLRRAQRWIATLRRDAQRRRGRMVPATEILGAWRRTGAAFERASLGRQPSETPNEHAARLAQAMARRRRLSPVVATAMGFDAALDAQGYRELAELATKAVYDRERCTDADALRALELETAVRAMADARPVAVPV